MRKKKKTASNNLLALIIAAFALAAAISVIYDLGNIAVLFGLVALTAVIAALAR